MSELTEKVAQGYVTDEVAALYLAIKPSTLKVYKSIGKIQDHPAVPPGYISTIAIDLFSTVRRKVGRPKKDSLDDLYI